MIVAIVRRSLRLVAAAAGAAFLAAAAPARLEPIPAPSVTILLFHQVTATPITSAAGEDQVKKPWVTPAEFDATLRAAEQRGYHFVSLEAALGFLSGRLPATALPPKPMLLTFDDGYASAWTDATPVLRAHHAPATMFFEGQLTGTKADRLTVEQLRAMAASGVWSLQSHGFVGHGNITIDAAGTRNPYWYANLMWRPDLGRLETPDEFEARVRADAHRMRATFESVTGSPIHVFAYPSGEYGQNDALAAGGDPATKLEAGHSNHAGLFARLERALKAEGFDAAMAVSVPGHVAPASRADDLFAIPRLGVGADFDFARVDALATSGIPLPEIVRDRFTDPGPFTPLAGGFIVAASAAPELYRLSNDGRVEMAYDVPALLDDRAGKPALVSGVAVNGDTVSVVQQAGWWPGATPRITRLRLNGDTATVLDRRPLAPALNWLVGIARSGDQLIGLTDDGTLYDVTTAQPLGTIALPSGAKRQTRFSGPAVVAGGLAVYDRIEHRLSIVDAHAVTVASFPLAGDLTALAGGGEQLYAVDAAGKRHVLLAWRPQ